MKTQTKRTLVVSTIAGALSLAFMSTAFAMVQPGWDRPILRAEMSVLDQSGNLPAPIATAKNVDLVMTQQDGTATPSGFVLLIDGQANQSYTVTSITKDACGATIYNLAPLQASGSYILTQTSQKLQLKDFSDEACMEFHRYRWEMNVQKLGLTRQAVGEMRLAGNPQSIISLQ